MPVYVYECLENGKAAKVCHPAHVTLTIWGQLCYVAQIALGDTSFEAPIRKVISPVGIITPTSNSELKARGFTKLVKRDEGVYENVTALDGEEKYMMAEKFETLPHLNRKIED